VRSPRLSRGKNLEHPEASGCCFQSVQMDPWFRGEEPRKQKRRNCGTLSVDGCLERCGSRFRHAFQCVAEPTSFVVQFRRQPFGDFRVVFCASLGSAPKPGVRRWWKLGLDTYSHIGIYYPYGKSSHNV
jgi:hypothetical protein